MTSAESRAVRDATRLSRYFTLRETGVSATHPEMVISVPPRYEPMARKLAGRVLDPAREAMGGPLDVLSWYRTARLNAAVGGSATSQHRFGEAADVCPRTRRALALFEWLRAQAAAGHALPHGQVIWYPAQNFVHVALPSTRYPSPTFCVHLPARGFVYRVVDPTTVVAHLDARPPRAA